MKRLVVCADGTWNTADQKDTTNVRKLYEALKPRDKSADGLEQKPFYHDGVGSHPGLVERVFNGIRGFITRKKVQGSLWQGITGEGLDRIIRACYTWLCENYEPNDQIFVFGFSRGAYTVRSLAGFIRKCGILKADSDVSIERAFEFYRNGIKPDEPVARSFRAANAHAANVWFIGVWDTVGSLGIPLGGDLGKLINADRQFHDVTLSSHVKYAFHAVSIDELRRPFAPTLWEQQAGADQTLEQTWFAGVHSNVGGGYPDRGLSDITFRWMAERATTAGLTLDADQVKKNVGPGMWNGVIYDSFGKPYDVLGRYARPIAAKRVDKSGKVIDTRESVHDSAMERFDKIVPPGTDKYSPSNLAAYLKERGRPGLPPIAAVPATPPGK